MIFHFDIVRLDRDNWRKTDWTLSALKATYAQIERTAGAHGWNTSFLTNHDNPRAVSHFGDDRPEWRAVSAKALATMMLTQRATPFLYQGDELGMTNYPFRGIEDYDDVEVKGVWRTLVETGKVSATEYLDHLRQTSRDNARTPMQWSAAANSGFTTGQPWLAVNPNYEEINAASQIDDPASVYSHHRRLLALRRQTPALIYGEYRDVDPEHENVFAYSRTLREVGYLVLINFSRERIDYALPGLKVGAAVLDNGAGESARAGSVTVSLAPWQATIYRMT